MRKFNITYNIILFVFTIRFIKSYIVEINNEMADFFAKLDYL